MGEVAGRLQRAREAYAEHDWPTAYSLLREEQEIGGLAPEDLQVLGDAAWWLGLIREVLEITEDCFDAFLGAGDVEQAALAALENGFNWFMRGEPVIGSGWLSRARQLLDDLPEGFGHGLMVWMDASERLETGDTDGALAAARRLRDMAGHLEAPVLGCFGLAMEGLIEIRGGEVARGLGMLDEAMLPVVAGRVEPGWAGNLYCQMMSICHQLADVDRARHWTEVTSRFCEGFPSAVMFVGICRVHRTQLLRTGGEWDLARQQATDASVELADMNVEAVGEAHYELAEIHRLRGELTEARSACEEARRRGRDPEPGHSLLLLAEDHPAEAVESIRRVLSEVSDPLRRTRLLMAQVEIACAVGDERVADAAAQELDSLAATYRTAGFRAWADHARGLARLRQGREAEALEALSSARGGYQAMGAVYDEAVARSLLSLAHEALGDASTASAELNAATQTFELLRAEPPRRWSTEPVGAVTPLPGGLTPREAEVLLAISAGSTNRQVAASLVISEATVARHLANIFAKIDVASRTAAAAWAHRNGLAQAGRRTRT